MNGHDKITRNTAESTVAAAAIFQSVPLTVSDDGHTVVNFCLVINKRFQAYRSLDVIVNYRKVIILVVAILLT